MKNNFLIRLFALAAISTVALSSCKDDNNSKPKPDSKEYGWSKTMAGNDPKEITWPDQCENYWEYTCDITENPNIGLRFKGQFPTNDVRFFNFTFYNDGLTSRITSIEDFNIIPDEGSKNPFDPAVTDAGSKNYFEVNVMPKGTAETVTKGMKNVLYFDVAKDTKYEVKRLSVLLRIYFNSTTHDTGFGGVALPEIFFVDTKTGKELGKAVRAKSNYYAACDRIVKSIPKIDPSPVMVFMLAPNIMYSNGPTGYVTSPNRLQKDETLLFRFLPPNFASKPVDFRTADVRYYSICVGDLKTHTPITLPDWQIIKSDDGYVNFMIIEKSSTQYAKAIEKAASMKINAITWDSALHGDGLFVFYRQMYIKDDFQYSVLKIPSFPPVKDGIPDASATPKPENMAHVTLGTHGPSGVKMKVEDVLKDDFNYDKMRMPVR